MTDSFEKRIIEWERRYAMGPKTTAIAMELFKDMLAEIQRLKEKGPFHTPCEQHEGVAAYIIAGVPNTECFGCYLEAVRCAAIDPAERLSEMRKPHLDLRPVDPKGFSGRRWKCLDCGNIATMTDMQKTSCIQVPKKSNQKRLLDAIEGKDDLT